MKKVLGALVMAGLCQAAFAAGMNVNNAWARTTVKGMDMGGAFLNVDNETGRDDVLLGGSTPVADHVEIHTHINENGVMKMRQVKEGVVLPKNKEVKLEPGSYHIMLMGLKAPLKEGQKFKLTLKFKNSKPQTVTVITKTPAQSNMPAMNHDHMMMDHGQMNHDQMKHAN